MEFFIIYTACCLTDVLDGALARKLNAVSDFGARLDSVSDLVLTAVLLFKLLPFLNLPIYLYIWTAAVAAVKIASVIIGFGKFKRLFMPHTIMNKAAGVLLFLYPLAIYVIPYEIAAIILCIIASVTAAEEITVSITVNEYNPDIKSILSIKRSNDK